MTCGSFHCSPPLVVNLCRRDVAMPKEVLDLSDVNVLASRRSVAVVAVSRTGELRIVVRTSEVISGDFLKAIQRVRSFGGCCPDDLLPKRPESRPPLSAEQKGRRLWFYQQWKESQRENHSWQMVDFHNHGKASIDDGPDEFNALENLIKRGGEIAKYEPNVLPSPLFPLPQNPEVALLSPSAKSQRQFSAAAVAVDKRPCHPGMTSSRSDCHRRSTAAIA